MHPIEIAPKLRYLAAAIDELADIEADRPLRKHKGDEDGCCGYSGSGAFGAPGDGDRRGNEQREGCKRCRVVLSCNRKQACAEEIGCERAWRDAVNAAGLRIRAEQESGDNQGGGKHKPSDQVENMWGKQA